MADDQALRQVPLHTHHVEHGARMVPFAGYAMPLQYEGLVEEHHAVRQRVGLFDVSHMAEFELRGAQAIEAIDALVTNDASALVDGQAQYSLMLDEQGGILDDLLVYRLAPDHIFICANAATRHEDFAHLQEHIEGDCELVDRSDDIVMLALQGPRAQALLDPICSLSLEELEYYHAAHGEVAGKPCLISRTGYTGEDGFELYIEGDEAGEVVFEALLEAGEQHELALCGLGCRDSLRLEAKMMLSGQDIHAGTDPFEAGLSWVVKLDKQTAFLGQKALREKKEAGPPARRMRGLWIEGRRVARTGHKLYVGDDQVGEVTSGGFSPTLEVPIALGYVDIEHASAEEVEVDFGRKRVGAKLTRKAFYERDEK